MQGWEDALAAAVSQGEIDIVKLFVESGIDSSVRLHHFLLLSLKLNWSERFLHG